MSPTPSTQGGRGIHPVAWTLNPSEYEWKQFDNDSAIWCRLALSNEVMWAARQRKDADLFLSASLSLNSLVSRAKLEVASKAAWQQLNYEVPELGLKGCWRAGRAYMLYQAPNTQEVIQWISRTTDLAFAEEKDFEALRQDVLLRIGDQKNKGYLDRTDMGYLFISAQPTATCLVSSFQLMMYVDHLITDGIGARILLGRYLPILATQMTNTSNPPDMSLNWEKSHLNLSRPWICLMNEDQNSYGREYDKVAAMNKEILTQKMKNNPGFPVLLNKKPESQETHFISLDETQSKYLLRKVKEALGPDSTITHLGHAAMIVAFLRLIPPSNTPTSHPQPLYSPCWLNGRRYLLPQSERLKQEQSYIPSCLSFAPIIFPDLRNLSCIQKDGTVSLRSMLVEACETATLEYGKIKARTSMLPECVGLFECLGEMMKSKAEAEPEKGTLHESSIEHFEPLFLSDGVIEQYINRQYFAVTGTPVFEVNEVKFAATAENNLIVRMSSWRDRITLSGEWRGCDYERSMIEEFLDDIKNIMLSL